MPRWRRTQVSGGADLFIGYGGVVERPAVAAGADWYVYNYSVLLQNLKRYTVRGVSRALGSQHAAAGVP
jgi:hypothetical protein